MQPCRSTTSQLHRAAGGRAYSHLHRAAAAPVATALLSAPEMEKQRGEQRHG
jgi:hypothetical protein